jgi:hypothetical protein
MASEWIKVVTNLTEKPEIIQISDATGIDCHGVVGRLIDVWSWASRNCRNDGVTHISGMRHINKITACETFAEAMVDCGWIMVKDNQMAFVNFDRHNSQTAKDRALAALRMAKKRGSENVTPALRSGYKKIVTRIDKNKSSAKALPSLPTSC